MKRARKALWRGLLGLTLLGAVLWLADPARVLGQLRQAQPGWLLAGLAAAIASNIVSALRWRALARWLGADMRVRDASRWYFQAIGLNALLPGAVLGGTALWLLRPLALPWLLRRGRIGWLAPLRTAMDRPDFHAQLLRQAIASAAVQLLSAAALAAGGLALGVHIGAAAWAFAIAPVFLMAALPASVGGWGTREAAAVAALAPFGVPAAAAVGTGVIYGLYQLAQGGMGALAFGLPGRGRAG